jgi:hypothetical protein
MHPEDGNLFAETYVGVVNTFYTCQLSFAFVGFGLTHSQFCNTLQP